MSFDSIFHGSPSSTGGQSVSSGRASLGIDVSSGTIYFRTPETGLWTPAAAASLVSPAFTGTPTAPTAAPLTDNTQLATTRYVDAAVAVETARAEGVLQSITITLTPAEILAMSNAGTSGTYVSLLPAIANTIYFFHSFYSNLQYAGTPYATGTGAIAVYALKGGVLELYQNNIVGTANLTSSSSTILAGSFPSSTLDNSAGGSFLRVGQPVVLALTNATLYTAGNSPVVITFWYTTAIAA